MKSLVNHTHQFFLTNPYVFIPKMTTTPALFMSSLKFEKFSLPHRCLMLITKEAGWQQQSAAMVS